MKEELVRRAIEFMSKRGYFGIGIYKPKTTENMGTLWRSAFLFGADFIFTVGERYKKQPTDTPKAMLHVPLYHYTDFDDLVEHLPAASSLVCIEMIEGSKSLKEMSHPERAVYLLGAEDYGIPEELTKGYQTVYIPTERPFSMNVAVCGSLVLYDRSLKD